MTFFLLFSINLNNVIQQFIAIMGIDIPFFYEDFDKFKQFIRFTIHEYLRRLRPVFFYAKNSF